MSLALEQQLRQTLGREFSLERSLPEQLLERLQTWVQQQEPGTRLPSERQLAQMAGVNRRTLRKALTALQDEGVLHRSARGTVIRRDADKAASPVAEPQAIAHPLQVFSAIVPPPVRPLVMSSFETLPWHQRMWQRLTAAYTAGSSVPVVIEPVPHDISNHGSYADYLGATRPDIAQVLPEMVRGLSSRQLVQPLPSELRAGMASDQLVVNRLADTGDNVWQWAVPVHFCFWLVLRNQNHGGSRLSRTMDADQLVDTLLETADRLPPGVAALCHPQSLAFMAGLPQARMTKASARAMSRAALAQMARLAPIAHRIRIEPGMFPAYLKTFLQGDAAYAVVQSSFALGALASLPFGCDLAMAQPAGTRWLSTGFSCLAAMSERDDAFSFMRFLLSEQAQTIIAEERANGPVRCDQLTQMLDALQLRTEDLFAGHRSESDSSRQAWVWFVRGFLNQPLLQVLRKGARPTEEMITDAWETYCKAHGS